MVEWNSGMCSKVSAHAVFQDSEYRMSRGFLQKIQSPPEYSHNLPTPHEAEHSVRISFPSLSTSKPTEGKSCIKAPCMQLETSGFLRRRRVQ